jgi:hypothetical protein
MLVVIARVNNKVAARIAGERHPGRVIGVEVVLDISIIVSSATG